MGLAVHHAEVICNDGLGGGVGGLCIATVLTGIHLYKAVMGQLGPDGAVHVVALQGGIFLLEGAIAEAAVAPTGGGDAVIAAVHLLNGLRFRQLLEEVLRTVIEPIHVFVTGVIGGTHVGVKGAAGLTDRLRPVVAGVVGIHAGGAVQQVALALPIQAGAIRILDVAGQSRLAVAGVLRYTEHLERGVLVTHAAVEGLDGHDGVGVQLVGPVERLLPMLGGVVVAILLPRKGCGHQGEQHRHGQERGQQGAQLGMFGFHE